MIADKVAPSTVLSGRRVSKPVEAGTLRSVQSPTLALPWDWRTSLRPRNLSTRLAPVDCSDGGQATFVSLARLSVVCGQSGAEALEAILRGGRPDDLSTTSESTSSRQPSRAQPVFRRADSISSSSPSFATARGG